MRHAVKIREQKVTAGRFARQRIHDGMAATCSEKVISNESAVIFQTHFL